MNDLFRLIDANLNRASEGVRVLEDLARFQFNDLRICGDLRALRHEIRRGVEPLSQRLLSARNSDRDVGLAVSQSSPVYERASLADLWHANFKRVQEAVRVMEETLKLAGRTDLATTYESLRFRAYTLERSASRVIGRARASAALDTDLYCITAEEYSRGRPDVEVVREMLAAGVKLIQYRSKDKELGAKHRDCVEIRKMTKDAGASLIVNDHADLAVMVEADGVHVGQDDYPIAPVREIVGPEMIIGASTHSPAEAEAAQRDGADYIAVGPLFPTSTKKNVCEPVGIEYLDYAVAHATVPFVAIGGIKTGNVREVRRRGARCVALVTEIVGASDIRGKIEEIRSLLREGSGEVL